MDFEQNLFISYAHIDNEPIPPSEQGWITQFHQTLAPLLSTRMGRTAKIWRDQKLQGNDVFSDEIVMQFKKSAALISVLSARYVESEWCTREAHEFCVGAKLQGGVTIDNKSQIFKVVKMPIEREDSLPPEMKEVLGYEFYTVEDDGTPLELDPTYGPKYAQAYRLKCATLAWNVAKVLKAIEARGKNDIGNGAEAVPAVKPSIYLAECSHDRKPAREMLQSELARLGYQVVPDKPLPMDEAGYIEATKSLLARCALSIHLVGEGYGVVPDGPTAKSVVIYQNELAVDRCRDGELARLIWLPKGTRSKHASQQAFIDALNSDANAQFGADLITGDIEELKAAIHATLRKIEHPVATPPPSAADETAETAGETSRLIYIICDERDRKATVPLRKFCRQHGFEARLPSFEGEAAEVRKAHQQHLAACDAVLLYYGAGDEGWRLSIENELRKMSGYRRKPLLARATYLAEPKTEAKQDLVDMEEAGLIDGRVELLEAAVCDFLAKANATSGSP